MRFHFSRPMSGPGEAPLRLTIPPPGQIVLLSSRCVSHPLRVERGNSARPLSCGTHSGFKDTRRNAFMSFITGISHIRSKALFTIVGGAVLINPAFVQKTWAQEQEAQGEELQEVVVTGLRGSLKASMETKRDAIGVVDAINAEDIGKFPDTNLSEALQRITGVSIDRRNGEGAVVTARGFGPQFNMVTLNGRQMPAADAFGNGAPTGGGVAGNSRSFNFANLAAEAISAVEVYKTSRAGIGASINVRTARPFDNDGVVLNLGVKALNDSTNRVGDDFTPELSGIFSYASENKMFGVGLTASYQ